MTDQRKPDLKDIPDLVSARMVACEELQIICKKRQVLRQQLRKDDMPEGQKQPASERVTGDGTADGDPQPANECETDADEARSFLSGVAFSGGGIRSATFCLGIIQALSRHGLLKRFDYLSTVSGGGYIGGWLTALIHREHGLGNNIADVENALTPTAGRSKKAAEVEKCEQKTDYNEHHAVRFLRTYTNYLTPRVGMLTADTWSAIATYIRNFALNLVSIVGIIVILLLLPRLLVSGHYGLAEAMASNTAHLPAPLLGPIVVMAVAMLIPAATFVRNMRAFRDSDRYGFDGQGKLIALFVVPFSVAALMASYWLPSAATMEPIINKYVLWIGISGLLYVGIWMPTTWGRNKPRRPTGDGDKESNDSTPCTQRKFKFPSWFILLLSSLGTAVIGGYLVLKFSEALNVDAVWKVIVGPPLYLVWMYFAAVLHTGLLSRYMDDAIREWLSRLGAWLLIFAIGWIALAWLALRGPYALDLASTYVKAGLAIGWIGSTVGGLLASRSKGSASGGVGKLRLTVLAIAPYVFVLGLLVLLSAAVDATLKKSYPGPEFATAVATFEARELALATVIALDPEKFSHAERKKLIATARRELDQSYLMVAGHISSVPNILLAVLLVVLIITFIALRLIDINEFSMHRFYQNRLVRAYLGASVNEATRREESQKFTGFFRGDDLELREDGEDCIDPAVPGPYHLINAALNLVGGSQLAWQQRKAASFLMSPLYCGYVPSGQNGAYRRSRYYACNPDSLTLGAAIAVSGAAASPNMGFRTSTAFAFLLSFFNVRLGRWIGNPGHSSEFTRSGPKFALASLVREMVGQASDDQPYVYVSDGGHFENLGIYELVRRKCRYIVACDAGADPDFSFKDLGNAIRKCRTDFGAEIEIDVAPIRNRDDAGASRWHCAIGTINYADPDRDPGTLLYIKTSLTGDEPEDVQNYAKDNQGFPHQSTGDQFFDESQFESYRALGLHVGDAVFGRAAGAADQDDPFNNEGLFQALQEQWYPPSSVAKSVFTRHSNTVDRLFNRLRKSQRLRPLNAQFYPEWGYLVETEKPDSAADVAMTDAQKTEAFYFCNSLIQLMENVYIDLNLEAEHSHPDNRGWINLFRHWAWSRMFRVTWAISACTYGKRFQAFCERHLDMDLGRVEVVLVDDTETFNPVEKKQISDFVRIEKITLKDLQIYRFVLQVNVHALTQPFSFPVGYAACDERAIHLFRIQDHLRQMGLGRKALKALLDIRPELEDASRPLSSLLADAATRAARIRARDAGELGRIIHWARDEELARYMGQSGSSQALRQALAEDYPILQEFDHANSETFSAMFSSVKREMK